MCYVAGLGNVETEVYLDFSTVIALQQRYRYQATLTSRHMSCYYAKNRSSNQQILSYSPRRHLPVSGNVLCRITIWRTNAPLASTSMHHRLRISRNRCKKKVRCAYVHMCVLLHVHVHVPCSFVLIFEYTHSGIGVSIICQSILTNDIYIAYICRIPALFPRQYAG